MKPVLKLCKKRWSLKENNEFEEPVAIILILESNKKHLVGTFVDVKIYEMKYFQEKKDGK